MKLLQFFLLLAGFLPIARTFGRRNKETPDEARGYKECEEFRNTKNLNLKSLDSICDDSAKCAHMEVMAEESCGFGVRRYAAGKWVGTKVRRRDGPNKMYEDAFWRLYKYIGGSNSGKTKIPMTVPVITNTYLSENFTEEGATMHLRLPAAFQEDPPEPKDKLVFIQDCPDDKTFYFRALGKEAKNTDLWKVEFEKLATALDNAGKKFWPYLAVAGGYTLPGIGAQRSEVMFGAIEHEEGSLETVFSEKRGW